MKCPACFNELSQLQVGKLIVDVCQDGCGGIWFDNFELQQVDEQSESAGERLMEIRRNPTMVVDSSRKRACPRCREIKLQRHFFSAKRKVEVDQCPNCGGYWLDAGELAAIREEKAAAEKANAASPGISSDTIRYLYRLRSEKMP
jgi:Zn-finger nucleic acid-binding protein